MWWRTTWAGAASPRCAWTATPGPRSAATSCAASTTQVREARRGGAGMTKTRFRHAPGAMPSGALQPQALLLRLQPGEGFSQWLPSPLHLPHRPHPRPPAPPARLQTAAPLCSCCPSAPAASASICREPTPSSSTTAVRWCCSLVPMRGCQALGLSLHPAHASCRRLPSSPPTRSFPCLPSPARQTGTPS